MPLFFLLLLLLIFPRLGSFVEHKTRLDTIHLLAEPVQPTHFPHGKEITEQRKSKTNTPHRLPPWTQSLDDPFRTGAEVRKQQALELERGEGEGKDEE